MTTLSNHVPDPRLITAYAERRDGPLHHVNPWTKFGVVGVLVLAVTVVDALAVLAGLYAATFVVYGIAGLPYRRLIFWYTLPMLFIVSVAGPLALPRHRHLSQRRCERAEDRCPRFEEGERPSH